MVKLTQVITNYSCQRMMIDMDIKELKQMVDKLKYQINFHSLSRIEMVHIITHLFEKIEDLPEK
jgi:hypothetical protein